MSAFLASQTTYDYIASGLYDAAIRHNSEAHYTVRKFLELEDDATDETLEHNITVAVRQLYDLNRLALVTRYGDQWAKEDNFTPVISHAAIINLAQFVKAKPQNKLSDIGVNRVVPFRMKFVWFDSNCCHFFFGWFFTQFVFPLIQFCLYGESCFCCCPFDKSQDNLIGL